MKIIKGKKFEYEVAEILKSRGYNVTYEKLIGSKKVDLIAEQDNFGEMEKYAVECKDYTRTISKKDISGILAEYQGLLDKVLVNKLLIVTRTDLSPAAKTYVGELNSCFHQTYDELKRSIIDFSPYLQELVSSYESERVSNYYVSQNTVDGCDLDEYVKSWIYNDSNSKPLAILGSYGMGKTTFSKRLSASLAKKAMSDAAARVPILIPLGLISSEQSLSGLLGTLFTEINCLNRYSFHSFSLLNNLGKLVVILDGFDEMKHTLSWSEFRYNFQQLLTLVSPNSKVIVLGRPTAFINDSEHVYILQGKYERKGRVYSVPDWPSFIEKELSMFDRDQVSRFVSGFYSSDVDNKTDGIVCKKIKYKFNEFEQALSSQNIRDIARRPVQLKMLLEILPEWEGDICNLTVAMLYDLFIDLMIKRKSEKVARKRFNDTDRRKFAKEVAWWIWESKSNEHINEQSVPDSLVEPFVRDNEDLESVKRDLLSSSILERKIGGVLYFPHRSFHEFLVAEKLYDMICTEKVDIDTVQSVVVGEVSTFLVGISDDEKFLKWLDGLISYKGNLTLNTASIFIEKSSIRNAMLSLSESSVEINISHRKRNPWYILLILLAVRRYNISKQQRNDIFSYFLSNIRSSSDLMFSQLNAFCAISLCGKECQSSTDGLYSTLRAIMGELVSPLELKKDDIEEKIISLQNEVGKEFDDIDPYQYLIDAKKVKVSDDNEKIKNSEMDHYYIAEIGSLKAELGSIKKILSSSLSTNSRKGIELRKYFISTIETLSNYCMVTEWAQDGRGLFEEFGLPIYFDMSLYERKLEDKNKNIVKVSKEKNMEKPKVVKRNRRMRQFR